MRGVTTVRMEWLAVRSCVIIINRSKYVRDVLLTVARLGYQIFNIVNIQYVIGTILLAK